MGQSNRKALVFVPDRDIGDREKIHRLVWKYFYSCYDFNGFLCKTCEDVQRVVLLEMSALVGKPALATEQLDFYNPHHHAVMDRCSKNLLTTG